MILPAPMLLSESRVPPFGKPGWIYEIKFDGHRTLAGIQDGQVQLASRTGVDVTKKYPEVVRGLATLPGGPHVIDGEVCVLDELGRSDFDRLQTRKRGGEAVTFCAFDLLARDGRSLIGLPVEARKAQLQELLTPALESVLYVDHFDAEHGRAMFEGPVHQLKLEGLVAKRLGSPYRPGERSADWVKVKRPGAVPAERFKRP